MESRSTGISSANKVHKPEVLHKTQSESRITRIKGLHGLVIPGSRKKDVSKKQLTEKIGIVPPCGTRVKIREW